MTNQEINILCHYGIKRRSGRYPYGSGDRPFQGEIRPAPRRRSGLSRAIQARKERKAAEEKSRKQAAQQRALEEAEKKAANKDRVLSSGRASEVLGYQGQLTNQELQAAVSRLNMEKSLKELSQKEVNDIWKQLDNIANRMQSISKVATATNTIYKEMLTLYKNLGLSRDQQGNNRG